MFLQLRLLDFSFQIFPERLTPQTAREYPVSICFSPPGIRIQLGLPKKIMTLS